MSRPPIQSCGLCGDNAHRETAALARRWTGLFAESFSLDFDKVALIVSPSTDEFLARAHAFGVAVNRETVFLSSSLSALPEHWGGIIVGHELAHAAQLARGGSDTENQLEAEAWQAVSSAMRGLPVRIRGGADRPLWAKGLIAVEGQLAQNALAHYRRFQAEPFVKAGGIGVTDPTVLNTVSFDDLLTAMIGAFPGTGGAVGRDPNDGSFMLYSHGFDDGLTMPLFAGSATSAQTTILKFLMHPQPNQQFQDPTVTSVRVSQLMQKRDRVKQLGIRFFEFRGCIIGRQLENLRVLKEFFGCLSVSAPDLFSNVGISRIQILSWQQFNQWVSATPNAQVKSYAGERFGVFLPTFFDQQFNALRAAGPYQLRAESTNAVVAWLKENFLSLTPLSFFDPWMLSPPLHSLTLNPSLFPMNPGYIDHIVRIT